MGLLFLGDERPDLVPMVEKVAQRVENLGLADAQRLGDLQDRFAAPVQGSDVADGHAQAVDQGLAAADAFEADDVRMFGFDGLGHALASEGKDLNPSPV
jgi:hypothetical protein